MIRRSVIGGMQFSATLNSSILSPQRSTSSRVDKLSLCTCRLIWGQFWERPFAFRMDVQQQTPAHSCDSDFFEFQLHGSAKRKIAKHDERPSKRNVKSPAMTASSAGMDLSDHSMFHCINYTSDESSGMELGGSLNGLSDLWQLEITQDQLHANGDWDSKIAEHRRVLQSWVQALRNSQQSLPTIDLNLPDNNKVKHRRLSATKGAHVTGGRLKSRLPAKKSVQYRLSMRDVAIKQLWDSLAAPVQEGFEFVDMKEGG